MTAAAFFDDLRAAGFSFRTDPGNRLIVAPSDRLNAEQRESIRQHKAALLRLLDAETLLHALTAAGPAGLDWREGTPPDWSDDRLLDAGEALYSDGRMVNVLGRRYLAAQAPRLPDQWSDSAPPQTTPQNAPSAPTSGLVDEPPAAPASGLVDEPPAAPASGLVDEPPAAPASEPDTPLPPEEPADPQAARIAELMATGWAPWNAKARAESEVLLGWQRPPLDGTRTNYRGRE